MPIYNIAGQEITSEEFNEISEKKMAEINLGDRLTVRFPPQLGEASFSGVVVTKGGSTVTLDTGMAERTNVWVGFVE